MSIRDTLSESVVIRPVSGGEIQAQAIVYPGIRDSDFLSQQQTKVKIFRSDYANPKTGDVIERSDGTTFKIDGLSRTDDAYHLVIVK